MNITNQLVKLRTLKLAILLESFVVTCFAVLILCIFYWVLSSIMTFIANELTWTKAFFIMSGFWVFSYLWYSLYVELAKNKESNKLYE